MAHQRGASEDPNPSIQFGQGTTNAGGVQNIGFGNTMPPHARRQHYQANGSGYVGCTLVPNPNAGMPMQDMSGGGMQGKVWSSPFGNAEVGGSQGLPTLASAGDGSANACAPSSAPGSDGSTDMQKQVVNMVLTTVADNISTQAATQVSQLQRRFPSALKTLRPYFSVSHGYVLQRLRQLLFPFAAALGRHRRQKLQHTNSDISKFDGVPQLVTNRDLYIPLMALVTYVLLVGVVKGAEGLFHPEVLSGTASVALLLLLLEVAILKAVVYLTNTSAVATFDLLSFCGYKYVYLVMLLILKIALVALPAELTSSVPGDSQRVDSSARSDASEGKADLTGKASYNGARIGFTIAFLYFAACAAVEFLVLLQSAEAADKEARAPSWQQSQGGWCRKVLTAAALLQIPLCWFLLPCKVFGG